MSTTTTNYGLSLPAVDSPTDEDLWGDELNANSSELDTLLKVAITFIPSAKTTSFSITAPTIGSGTTGDSKKLFRCNATAGAIVPSLPSASSAGAGFTVAFKKTDAVANNVTVTAAGSDKIDGSATFALTTQNDWIVLTSDGISEWDIISESASTAGFAPLASPTFTGIPKAPTPAALDRSKQIPTTDWINPGSTLAVNGSRPNPDGSIDQWGITGSIGTITSSVISFPNAFPNACFNVIITAGTAASVGQSHDYITSITASGFTLFNAAGSASIFYWRAIGN